MVVVVVVVSVEAWPVAEVLAELPVCGWSLTEPVVPGVVSALLALPVGLETLLDAPALGV